MYDDDATDTDDATDMDKRNVHDDTADTDNQAEAVLALDRFGDGPSSQKRRAMSQI